MQAYEGHIPYLLKFTSDLSISPMGWITLKEVQVSAPPSTQPNLLKTLIAVDNLKYSFAPRVTLTLTWRKSPAASWKWMRTLEILSYWNLKVSVASYGRKSASAAKGSAWSLIVNPPRHPPSPTIARRPRQNAITYYDCGILWKRVRP